MTSERLAAQQTPTGVYFLLLYFSCSGPVIDMKCGHNRYNATANPPNVLPITCANKNSPHVQHTYDMIPALIQPLFTIFPANSSHDCGPNSPDGLPISAPISIGTQVHHLLFSF